MDNEKKQYPLKKTFLFTGDVLTITFSYTVRYGNNKRETDGEDVAMLLDKRGDVYLASGSPESLEIICDGVAMICEYNEEMYESDRGIGYFKKRLCIHRDACPVVLYINEFCVYEDNSWKDQKLKNYSIRVQPINLKRHRDIL